jgi:hypothetical protein
MNRQRRFRYGLLLASILLYVLSLAQDGFYIDRVDRDAYAPCWGLLLIGWLGVFDGMFAWLANPLLLVAWVFTAVGRSRTSAVSCAIVALGFSLSFLVHNDILTDEGGGRSAITEYGWGYWLWNMSIVLEVAAAGMVGKQASLKIPEQIAAGDVDLGRKLVDLSRESR